MLARITAFHAFWWVVVILCLAGVIPVQGQSEPQTEDPANLAYLPETEYRLVTPGLQPLKLAHGFCLNNSFVLQVEGQAWQPGIDFRVRARSGVVVPLRPWAVSGVERAEGAEQEQVLVVINYRFLPVALPARMDLRPVGKPPTAGGDGQEPGSDPSSDGLYFTPESSGSAFDSGNLQVSGSKTVQVSSGNRREMTVDQNLRLSIVGQLTDEIFVRAFLSDDNLPVIPEGNTEELRDIDKVLVEMTAPGWKATLGDFVAERHGSTFGNYRRKLQGFSLVATPGNSQLGVLAGSPRGQYQTLQIRGQEQNQGPYYLGGGSSGENLFIVAGSERVTLDGELLRRGQDRDYTIDYVRGTVTFTYRRLITAESNIFIEYEEGEGAYGRTVVGAGGGTAIQLPGLGTQATVSARVVREKDDPNRLRTGELGDQDLAILEAAGDDPLLALAPGVIQRDPGEGLYDQAYTGNDTIYVYNPLGGDYDVEFFYVGPAQGDYTLDSLTETGVAIMVHTGTDLGNYLIGRPLAMPSSQSVATFQAALGDTASDHLSAEMNVGEYDRNQLSDIGDDDNQGTAARVAGKLRPKRLRLGDQSLGTVSLNGFWENQSDRFKAFQVHKTIFDYDDWGLADRARREGFLEQEDEETGLTGAWMAGAENRSLELRGSLGRLKHGANLEADRWSGNANWRLAGGRGRHVLQEAGATDTEDPLDITHQNQSHDVSWFAGPVEPGMHYNFRQWEDGKISGTRAAGYRLEELGARLGATPGGPLTWNVEFTRGLADSLVAGLWELQRDSRTWTAGLGTGRMAGMRLTGEGTVRQVKSPDKPEQITRLAQFNLSGDWNKTASNWSFGYRVDNNRTEVLNRQIVFVGESQGDYNEDGEFVGIGLGDYNMVLASTDSLVATTSVLADINWRQGFSWLGDKRWYSSWNALTLASVEGRSTAEDVGGLLTLNPGEIFHPEYTVLGDFHFSEELTMLQHINTVDLRMKFDFRETMDRQYADHPEDRLQRNWQVNGNINLSRISSLRLRWNQQNEQRFSAESSASVRRSFDSLSHRYEAAWHLRPSSDTKLILQGEYITRRDEVSGVEQKELALRPNARQRLARQWTIQADVRLADVTSDEPVGSQRPWFYSYPGRNLENTLRVSWEPSRYLSVSASWFGRKQGDRRWQHDVRLESTARF